MEMTSRVMTWETFMLLSFLPLPAKDRSRRAGRVPRAQWILREDVTAGGIRPRTRSTTHVPVRADPAPAVETVRRPQAPEEGRLAVDGERVVVGDPTRRERQESRGRDVAVGGDEHDPVAVTDPEASRRRPRTRFARSRAASHLEDHAPVMWRLRRAHLEWPRSVVAGEPSQQSFAGERPGGGEGPGAADRHDEEKAPARGAESSHELGRLGKVFFGLVGDQGVDLERDAGCDDVLGRRE